MPIRYKLTDKKLQTYNGFQWELGKEVTVVGNGELCTSGWIHVYSDPLLAVLLNPIHANFNYDNLMLFKAKCAGKHKDDHGLKQGWQNVTLVKELNVPVISRTQRIVFGILCVKEVRKDEAWLKWANGWLDGTDRSEAATWAAARAAEAAAEAAAMAAMAAEAAAEADNKIDLIKLAKAAMKY